MTVQRSVFSCIGAYTRCPVLARNGFGSTGEVGGGGICRLKKDKGLTFLSEYKQPKYVNFMDRNYRPGFTYQEFAKDFTAELFNADEWADLFQKSGAKYVVLTSKHHDGFALWPSTYSFSWNAVDLGPHRDIIGESPFFQLTQILTDFFCRRPFQSDSPKNRPQIRPLLLAVRVVQPNVPEGQARIVQTT
jgi:Alpha-L-fucosidase